MATKEQKKLYRDRFREKADRNGLCINCGKNPQKETSKLCVQCTKRSVENRSKLRLKRLDKCSQCLVRNPVPGRKLCQICADRKHTSPSQRRKQIYNLSDRDYQEMLRDQNNRCAICSRELDLCVDHDHISGEVRGLLCNNCNNGLGRFKDRVEFLKSAINYLENRRLADVE